MRRASFYMSAILALLMLAGAFAWRVPSNQELLHPNPELVLLSGHTHREVPRVEVAENVAGITLPIEVFSGTGTATKSVTVNVNNGDGRVNRLWMQVHQPSYKYGDGSRGTEGLKVQDKSSPNTSPKMWVRVNGGSWVKVDNNTATCARLERTSSAGCIGGGFETVRFTVPVSGVKNGANTVEFYFNGTEGFTSGFRVLNFDFLPSGYAGDLTHADIERANAGRITDELIYEDMSRWTAPAGYNTAAHINAGKTAWESAQLLDFVGGPRIKATCSDCHASDGRDLKYFNYSNEVIVARSRHHGLSEEKANQIAAYIRSLDVPAVGTPWDPAYQPGPTRKLPTMGDCIQGRPIDELPQHCWAAGAGLDWVLENDLDAEPYIFPNGITESAVDVDETLNIRAIPIAAQFPDWNEWLPRVHPIDSWGSAFTSDNVNTYYSNSVLPTVRNPASKANGEALKRLMQWGAHHNQFLLKKATFNYFDSRGVPGKLNADYILSYTQWYAVKQWEVMTTYGLEDMAPLPKNYGRNGEVRSWVGVHRNVFDVAPHIHWKKKPGRDLTWPHGSKDQWSYFSAIWYQVQLTLNAGNRNGITIRPVDWKYQILFLPSNQPYRHAATYVKMLQELNNENGVDDGDSKGWYFRHVTPAWLFASHNKPSPSALKALGPKEPAVMTAIMQAWIEKTMRHPVKEWTYRPNGCDMKGLSSAAYKPTPYKSGTWMPGGCYADQMYRLIPALEEAGVAKSTLDSIATWAAKMWPKGNWSALVDYKPGPNAGVTLQIDNFASPALDAQYRQGDVVTFSGTTTNDGAIARMEGWVNGVKKCEARTVPFRCTWTADATGRYRGSIRFYDGDGKVLTSVERGFDVIPANAPIAQKLKLKKGWNTVSLSVVPADSSIQSVMSTVLADVVLVKNADGRVYSPELDVAQISHWSPREAYMVYARRDVDWSVKGTPVAPDEVAIGLKQGWNWVPYPHSESLPIDEALEPVSDNLVLVTDADGKVYYPSSSINTIGLMSPGHGYKVFVDQACTLVFSTTASPERISTSNLEVAAGLDEISPEEDDPEAEYLEDYENL